MTREEEQAQILEYIKKNGVVKLPPGSAIKEDAPKRKRRTLRGIKKKRNSK